MDRSSEGRHYLEDVKLVDNHCHSVSLEQLSAEEFEDRLTEAPSRKASVTSTFDSAAGLTLLAKCGPLVGLDPPFGPLSYISARRQIAPETLAQRCFANAGVEVLMVDTLYSSDPLATLDQLKMLSGAQVMPIVRLESLGEQILASSLDAAGFFDEFSAAIFAAAQDAVGLKSIAAYRFGLDLESVKPSRSQVQDAALEVVREIEAGGIGRIGGRVLCSFLAHAAIETTGLPLQFHVGYGDPDLQLDKCNPALLTPFIRRADALGVPVVLLHCYPYHREAAYLAHCFSNVYLDLGLTMNFVGHNASRIFAETLELAPFAKVLYSSDAYALPELHFLGASAFRESVDHFLESLRERELAGEAYLRRLALMFARDNASRAYRL